MRRRQTWELFGNLGVAVILLLVAAQAFLWLGSPPSDASTLRHSLVVAQLILGVGLAVGLAALTIVRYRRTARA